MHQDIDSTWGSSSLDKAMCFGIWDQATVHDTSLPVTGHDLEYNALDELDDFTDGRVQQLARAFYEQDVGLHPRREIRSALARVSPR